jgi:hypothetical protein
VSLGKIWRLIAMPAESLLDDLVAQILQSVKFDDDHLYEFTYRDRFGNKVSACHPAVGFGIPTDRTRLADLPLDPGQPMNLTYDFGDEWPFLVTLVRMEPPGAKLKGPRILESHGKAPRQYPHWED